ncbi:MAG: AMP-binding protein, partial [Ilumatobacteraceae bacterium]
MSRARWPEPDPGSSLWELLERRAAISPESNMAVDERGVTMTFGQYRHWCCSLAGRLSDQGVQAGQVVSWQIPTWLDAMVLAGALDWIGAVQNPLLPQLRRREVEFITAEAGSRWYVQCGEWRGFDYPELARATAVAALRNSGQDMGVIEIGRDSTRSMSKVDERQVPEPDRDGTRWLFYTSGTTGQPKGVRHGHAAVVMATLSMCRGMRVGDDDRSVVAFPFTHIGGINWLMAALLTGCSLLVIESFAAADTMDVIAANDVTLAGVSTAFHLAYLAAQRRDPERPLMPRVRAYPGGAAPKPPALHHDLVREVGGVGIVSGFGLTEFPMIAMGSIDDNADQLAMTEGRPSPGVDLIVVDVEGNQLSAGRDGELRAKGPHLMLGYVDAALDADAFDTDGYFRTGDLGHLDQDGHVVITGRLKDVIIRKGENISAQEIENLLYEHPDVADAAVIGVADVERGEMVCAVIAPRAGSNPTLEDLLEHLRRRDLMPQKLPERLILVDEMPRNASGKVRKDALRE